ncbi:MAG: SGNH/GDSL hydrolase family protein, partial [Planctomycetales bacterium]|nr:SGNH/GDSL hydrolase family protein [Planctomycetales bacterium]
MRFRLITACFFCGVLFVLPLRGKAGLVIFGDSLSDSGNTFLATSALTPSPLPAPIPNPAFGYTAGAFTNGRNWLEPLADRLGEASPVASRVGGSNFAHGGASFATSGLLRPSLSEQVNSYLGSVSNPNALSPSDWHIFWGGANDLLGTPSESVAAEVANVIRTQVDNLYQLGARRFLVLNLPRLGATPLAAATGQDVAALDRVSLVFNADLAQQLQLARVGRADIELFEFDTAAFFAEVSGDPTAFGLSEVREAATTFDAVGSLFSPQGLALAAPAGGINADAYLFYDGLHPTAAAHSLLGQRVADAITAIPEPTAALLLVSGLMIWLGRRRRPRAIVPLCILLGCGTLPLALTSAADPQAIDLAAFRDGRKHWNDKY